MVEAAPLPHVLVITDWTLGDARLLERLERALSAGPRVAVQHRHPGVSTRQYLEEARAVARIAERAGNLFFINDRLDVALLLSAHLHLPSHGYRPRDVRAALPSGRLLSVAVHEDDPASDAEGADFALVSPVFSSLSKPDARVPLGEAGLRRLERRLPCAAFALGGITRERLRMLGPVAGCATIGEVLHAEDPREAAEALLAHFDS